MHMERDAAASGVPLTPRAACQFSALLRSRKTGPRPHADMRQGALDGTGNPAYSNSASLAGLPDRIKGSQRAGSSPHVFTSITRPKKAVHTAEQISIFFPKRNRCPRLRLALLLAFSGNPRYSVEKGGKEKNGTSRLCLPAALCGWHPLRRVDLGPRRASRGTQPRARREIYPVPPAGKTGVRRGVRRKKRRYAAGGCPQTPDTCKKAGPLHRMGVGKRFGRRNVLRLAAHRIYHAPIKRAVSFLSLPKAGRCPLRRSSALLSVSCWNLPSSS